MKNKIVILLLLLPFVLTGQNFTPNQAEVLSKPALRCIQKPYPYKPGKVLGSDADVVAPKVDHPETLPGLNG